MVQPEFSITLLYFVINFRGHTIFFTISCSSKTRLLPKIILEMPRETLARCTCCVAFDCTSRTVESLTAANRVTGSRIRQCRRPPAGFVRGSAHCNHVNQ